MSEIKAEGAEAPTVTMSDVTGDKDGDSKYEYTRGDPAASTGSDSHDVLLDLTQYHEHNAGRLVVDPEYVKIVRIDIIRVDMDTSLGRPALSSGSGWPVS